MSYQLQYNEDNSPYVLLGQKKLQLESTPAVEKFYKEKAESELRETTENISNGLKKLRELIKSEPTLSVPLENDDFLTMFLRPCKFYADGAFERMKFYYKFRQSHPDYCKDLVPDQVKSPFEKDVVSFLAPRDQHGRRVLLIESGDRWNPREVSLKDLFRGVQIAVEAAMEEARTQICGVVVIFDMKGLSLSQVIQFTPSFAKMVVEWAQDCLPVRLKAIHIINQPYVFNMLFALFKPFLREKLRSRIHFHGSDKKSLLSHVSPDSLRSRHGGNMPDPEIPGIILWQMLKHYDDKFKVRNSFGYPEKMKK